MGAQNYGDLLKFFENKVITASQDGAWLSSASCGALRRAKEIVFVLDVTAAATLVGDTLDVKVQNGLEGSAQIWPNDVVHFTQVLGNGGAKQYIARIITGAAVAATGAPSTALAASTVVNGPTSDLFRYSITVAGTGSFTASLKAYIKG